MLNYKEKYLKYKKKYINFKNTGGTLVEIQNCMHSNYYIDDIIEQINILKKMILYIIQELKLKQIITFENFMYLEKILNYVYNIKSFIGYYKKKLLSIKQSPIMNSKHNELYNLVTQQEGTEQDKKEIINKFISEYIINKLEIILNLLDDEVLLVKLKNLLRNTITRFEDINKYIIQGDINILNKHIILYEEQNIYILIKYINMISININDKLRKKHESEAYTIIDKLWKENQQLHTSNETKIINYRNIFLKFLDSAELTGYSNILEYHQNKEVANYEAYEDIKKILVDNLIIYNNKHKLLENKFNNQTTINTKELFQMLHKKFIETKYGDIHNIINNNININNIIEGLRWIVYKYYNLLMIKTQDCNGYREDINVYNFYNKKTNLLVGVIYFDLNYNQLEQRGYIYEFRKRYKYTNVDEKFIKDIVPIICLYIDFKVVNLTAIKSLLLHEFGHAIHTILSQNYYQHLSPNTMKFDYVEIMSQLFELYIFEKEFISRFLVKEDIPVRHIPNYDNLLQTQKYDKINFQEYFNESENIFFDRIGYILISLLEIKLKVLSKEDLTQLNIIDYSNKFLQNLKTKYQLPNYVSYKIEVLKFKRIYNYPLYYAYLMSLLKVNQIREQFGSTLFNIEKTNIYINDILSKGDVNNISEEINKLLSNLKEIN